MRKTMVRFFTIADFEEEEIWLRRQHQSGLKLVRMIAPCFYVFETVQPQDVIYRLDFKDGRQTEDYRQMLRDYGWEYLGQCLGWLYFRKPAAEAESLAEGELFSDGESRLDLISHIVKARLWPLVFIFLCCVLPNLLRSGSVAWPDGVKTFFTVFFGVMFVVYLFLITYTGVKLKLLKDKYKKS